MLAMNMNNSSTKFLRLPTKLPNRIQDLIKYIKLRKQHKEEYKDRDRAESKSRASISKPNSAHVNFSRTASELEDLRIPSRPSPQLRRSDFMPARPSLSRHRSTRVNDKTPDLQAQTYSLPQKAPVSSTTRKKKSSEPRSSLPTLLSAITSRRQSKPAKVTEVKSKQPSLPLRVEVTSYKGCTGEYDRLISRNSYDDLRRLSGENHHVHLASGRVNVERVGDLEGISTDENSRRDDMFSLGHRRRESSPAPVFHRSEMTPASHSSSSCWKDATSVHPSLLRNSELCHTSPGRTAPRARAPRYRRHSLLLLKNTTTPRQEVVSD